MSDPLLVSIVIPARNEAASIGHLVRLVRAQRLPGLDVEVIVVDDASTDRTAQEAANAGARVVAPSPERGGNPAIGRNRGAAASRGGLLVFLDADCTPRAGWLETLVGAYREGVDVVGGSLGLPPGLSFSARCDYYCGWYNHHPASPAGLVKHHPPGNLSVRREVFGRTMGFWERQPIAFAHEELHWQAEVQRRGGALYFEPKAVVDHHNRPGFANLLRRNYRWGYSAIEAKAATEVARLGWLYEQPWLLILGSPVIALGTTLYIVLAWLRAGLLEPVLMLPFVLAARIAYSTGMVAGGIRWMRTRHARPMEYRPRWE